MKKLDKLFLQLFLRYLLLVLPVIVLLLLTQYLLKYFDDFAGKGVSVVVYAKLIFYLSANMVPMALNLSVMISALMTYGTMGEHSELTAIKASGISSLRLLYVVFLFVVMLSVASFFANAYLIPRINLKAFLLLHDIRQKKPAFNIQEKQFYSAIPGYSIRIYQKLPDNKLKGVMIYDHSEEQQRKQQRLVLADSGYMYSNEESELLHLDLFNGNYYLETQQESKRSTWKDLLRSQFSRLEMTFSLSSFQLKKSAEKRLSHLRRGKQVSQLFTERDSMQLRIDSLLQKAKREISTLYLLHNRYKGPKINLPSISDSLKTSTNSSNTDTTNKRLSFSLLQENRHTTLHDSLSTLSEQLVQDSLSSTIPLEAEVLREVLTDSALSFSKSALEDTTEGLQAIPVLSLDTLTTKRVDKAFLLLWKKPFSTNAISTAAQQAQYIGKNISYRNEVLHEIHKKLYRHELEAYSRYTLAYSCLVMFLLGATIGGIIKKGGLGIPILVAISFFIIFHVVSVLTEKYAREGLMPTWIAAWSAGALLSVFAMVLIVLLAKDVRLWDRKSFLTFFSNILPPYKRK